MRGLLRSSLMVIIAIFLAASRTGATAPQFEDRSNKVIPPVYFGMHIHRADSSTAWPGREIGSWRLWDAGTLWIDMEPKSGQWDFTKLNRYVAMAALTNTEIDLPLGMTPEWASARPLEKGVYKPHGDASEPRRIEDWENYVRTVTTRYKGRIHTYELWNEVNAGTGFFSGTPQALFALHRAAYRIVKEVDPSAVLVSPSGVGEADHQLAWFENYLSLGAKSYTDVVSYHFYQPRKRPEAIIGLVKKIKAIAARQGLGDKELWNTESGYRIALDQKTAQAVDPTWPELDQQRAGAYVARALILGWWAGLDRFYWYAWDNSDMGFMNKAGKVEHAGRAFRTVAQWMVGARLSACAPNKGVWTCNLNRDGNQSWLVWSEDDTTVQWALPMGIAKSTETLDGNKYPIPENRLLTITGSPQLVTTQAAP